MVVIITLLFCSVFSIVASQVNMRGDCPQATMFATATTMKIASITAEDETPRCDQTAGLSSANWFRLQGPGGTGITSRQPKRSGIYILTVQSSYSRL